MSFKYLASPYTHPDRKVRHTRYEQVMHYAAYLMRQKIVVYSPIAHSHPMSLRFDLPETPEFWRVQNYGILAKASELLILRLEGWDKSLGVHEELEFARCCQIPIVFADYTLKDWK